MLYLWCRLRKLKKQGIHQKKAMSRVLWWQQGLGNVIQTLIEENIDMKKGLEVVKGKITKEYITWWKNSDLRIVTAHAAHKPRRKDGRRDIAR
jgi:hypothetical protein